MDPTTLDPALVAATSTATGMNQIVLIIISLLGTIVSTGAMLWKTSRDQNFALAKATADQAHSEKMFALQHQLDMHDRQSKAEAAIAAAAIAAGQVRERLASDAAATQQTVHQTALHVADKLSAQELTVKNQLDVQTEVVKRQIDSVAETVKHEAEVVLGAKTIELQATADDRAKLLMEAVEAAKHFTADKADAAYHEANSINEKLSKANSRIEELYAILTKLMEAVAPKGSGDGGGSGGGGGGDQKRRSTDEAMKTAKDEVNAVGGKDVKAAA